MPSPSMRPAALLCLLAGGLAAQPVPPRILRPQAPGAPYPAILVLQGGGSFSDAPAQRLVRLFSNAGLAVLTTDRHRSSAQSWPAAVDDVLATLRWVRTHARRQAIDPRRIALAGYDAGGTLATMAAARGAPVRAVVSLAAWSDFRNQPLTPSLAAFLGPTLIEAASPAMHLTGREPPFLLLHGDRDETIPLSQSLHLQSALQAVRVPCSLIIVEGGAHDPLTWETLPAPRPWEREMLVWLQKAFRKRR